MFYLQRDKTSASRGAGGQEMGGRGRWMERTKHTEKRKSPSTLQISPHYLVTCMEVRSQTANPTVKYAQSLYYLLYREALGLVCVSLFVCFFAN